MLTFFIIFYFLFFMETSAISTSRRVPSYFRWDQYWERFKFHCNAEMQKYFCLDTVED